MNWWSDLTPGSILITLSNMMVFGAAVIGFAKMLRGVEKVHVLVNSQLTEFKALLVKSAHAEGVLEGQSSNHTPEPAKVEVVKSVPVTIEGQKP